VVVVDSIEWVVLEAADPVVVADTVDPDLVV
jgi:hypothetical protein